MSGIDLIINESMGRLRLNQPAVFNALSPEALEALIRHCETLRGRTDVRVVVLEGAGPQFCAGANLPSFIKRLESEPDATADLGRRAAEALATLPQITLACLHGYCIGGGLVLAGACDMRVAADNTLFSVPELDAGIPLSWGGMDALVRLVGPAVANDYVLTGRPFDAAEALRTGLISRVIPSAAFEGEIQAIAAKIASQSALTLAQTKGKLLRIQAGTFDARDDAAEMLAALRDPETLALNAAYIKSKGL